MERRESSYAVGGNVKRYSYYREQHKVSLKIKKELPCVPAIQLLGIYLGKTIIQKDTYTPMFTAALFRLARTWTQPKHPSTEEWIKSM